MHGIGRTDRQSGRPFSRRGRSAAGLALALLAVLAGAPAAGAQTVEELQAELADTREELRVARSLISTLREEIARLQAEVHELRGLDTPEVLAEAPAEPLACPASLAMELSRRYERDLAPLPKASPRDGFDEAAERWCERMRRELRGRREWLVAVTDLAQAPGSPASLARIRVYDEVSLLPLSEFEEVEVPARFAARLRSESDVALWLLTCEVGADPVYNPSRAERGAFDEPPFVGPYVESGFTLDWAGLTPTDLSPTPPDQAPAPAPPHGRDR